MSRVSSCEFSVLTTENGTEIKFNYADPGDGAQFKKIVNGEVISDWAPYDAEITVDANTVVMFRSKRTGSYDNQIYGGKYPTMGNKPIFTFSKPVKIYGDIMSLKSTGGEDKYIIGNTLNNEHEFAGAFWGVDNMDIHEERYFVLSAQNLSKYCYQNMFRQNSSITAGNHIIISASKMVPFCCNGMFKGCSNFASAPVIKAEELAESCCQSMFEDCNLTEVPALPATILAKSCYRQMFRNSTNLKSVPQNLLSHVTNLEPYCYFSMFDGCTSLKNAPDLPAATLVTCCYETMFGGTKVTSIKCLATNYTINNTNHEKYTKNWLPSNNSQGTFIKKKGADWDEENYTGPHGIPNGWNVIGE